jgi:pimeloyl-ACP methyl ester carboxylesterase
MREKKVKMSYSAVVIELLWVVLLIHVGWATIASVICLGHYQHDYPLSAGEIKTYRDDSSRKQVFFNGTDARIHGWVYTPNPMIRMFKKSPLVIVAHGLGAQKDMGLDFYCRQFVKNGFACLGIDYRTFGGSDALKSQPKTRNLINPWYHVADIKTVVAAVGTGILGPSIDETKIALWGTSFGGGHVLSVAADLRKNSAIKAIVSQVPHLDGKVASKRGARQRGILGTVRLAILAISDMIRARLGLEPIYIRIVGNLKETGKNTVLSARRA